MNNRRRHFPGFLALSTCILLLAVWTSARGESPLAKVQLDAKTLRGTEGFFRVGQDTLGRWWFVTPDGQPFYYRGVTSINRAGEPGGRRAQPGPYAQAVGAKYAGKQAFAEAQVRRLRQWGFNALGAWCTEEFFDLKVDGAVMPYTEILEFGYVGPQIVGPGVWLPDVFDDRWTKAADDWAKKICLPRKDSAQLVGYFTDNELGWAQAAEEDAAQQADPNAVKAPGAMLLLQHCLTLPETSGSFKAAWDFAMKRYARDLKAISKAWGVSVTDSSSIRALNPGRTAVVIGDGTLLPRRQPGRGAGGVRASRPKTIDTPGYFADQEAFSLLFAQQYFRACAQAIRKHDPNHLILGCRFGGPPGHTVLAGMNKEWVDVISANNYRAEFYERMDIYYKGTGLPVLNGEFAYHSGTFKPLAKTRAGMAAMGATSMEKLFTHGAVIGYTWYRWDADDAGTDAGMSCGLVDMKDQPLEPHISTLTAVNRKAEPIAAGRSAPPPPAASAANAK